MNSRNNKPNFLIVGASKSGTTSLIKYLGQHPDVFIPKKIEEPRFFVKSIIEKIHRVDPLYTGISKSSVLDKKKYFDLFKTQKVYKCYGENSIHYLNHPEIAIKNIKKHIGDIPIIIILRNPIDRLVSNWQFIASDIFPLEKSLDLESQRKKWKYNSFWFYKEQSLYYKKVKQYLDNFERVKIILFEDFISDPGKTMRECTDFLKIDPYLFDTKIVFNKTKENYFLDSKFITAIENPIIYLLFMRIEKYLNLPKKSKKTIIIQKKKIYKLFEEDISKMEKLIGKKLSVWNFN